MNEKFQEYSESPNMPIGLIQSHYSVEQLPSDESCKQCNSVMQAGEMEAYELRGKNITIRTANKVPVFRCRGDSCGGTWFAPEVTLDLISQAIPILRGKGELDRAEALEQTQATLQKIVQDTPTIFNKIANS